MRDYCGDIYHMGHAQRDETNRIGRKIPLAVFAIELQIFQLLRYLIAVKPIGVLS